MNRDRLESLARLKALPWLISIGVFIATVLLAAVSWDTMPLLAVVAVEITLSLSGAALAYCAWRLVTGGRKHQVSAPVEEWLPLKGRWLRYLVAAVLTALAALLLCAVVALPLLLLAMATGR